MRYLNIKMAAMAVAVVGALVAASFADENKPQPTSQPAASLVTATTQPGVAGGTLEGTFTASATVSAIDAASRNVTLSTDDGKQTSFTAGPEIRNFDQLHVGDKVNVTINEKLVVFVRGGDEADPTVTHASALATAPKGAKPGAIVAQEYEIVADVKAIDPETRNATLEFADGQTRVVKVRPDVDLSKYKAGDNVVIRITETIAVLAEKP
jgi:Cu/Ag efflux protein CusF